jgi:hypothetical protein
MKSKRRSKRERERRKKGKFLRLRTCIVEKHRRERERRVGGEENINSIFAGILDGKREREKDVEKRTLDTQ